MWIALSELGEEFTKKIKVFNALAPATYMKHQGSVLIGLLAGLDLDRVVQLFGFNQFLPSNKLMKDLTKVACGADAMLCEEIIFMLCGKNTGDPAHDLNKTRV